MTAKFVAAVCSIVILGALAANAGAQTTTIQPAMVCGLEIYPSPTGIPSAAPAASTAAELESAEEDCADGTTIFGPAEFARASGKPVQSIVEFDVNPDAEICVVAKSSDKGKAFLYLDGLKITEPEDFDDGEELQKHSVSAGMHGIGVTPVGTPGGIVEVEIRQLGSGGGDPDIPGPGEVRIDPATGSVDMVNADSSVRLQNVASDHPLLTPNGDGDNDTTVMQALTTPLVELPGKDDGAVAYFLNWDFQVVDLLTCNTIDTGLSGQKQINSPTLVTTEFDGLDASGAELPDGTYAYVFDVTVVDEDDSSFGTITSPGFGFAIDRTTVTDYNEAPEYLGGCTPAVDPDGCLCPAGDPDCQFSYITDLLPELGLPPGTDPSYMNPELVKKSFISTTLDASTGRYTVTVDLRKYNAGGLVPKARGMWASEDDLRQWVSDMTGVPLSTGDSLFNFDYVQLGTSTGVNRTAITNAQFNHFFLDAITDADGRIRVAGTFFHPISNYNDDLSAPFPFVVTGPREGDECASSANTDGVRKVRSKFCAYNNSFSISPASNLGFHALRTTLFDVELFDSGSGEWHLSQQDEFCVLTPTFTCGVRTFQFPVSLLEIDSSYYEDVGADAFFLRSISTSVADAVGVSVSADRVDTNGPSGVCSRAVATQNGLAVRLDAADGAVPDTCVINGIF